MSGSVLPSLQSLSNQADLNNGLPIGTTYAIAGTESSYGQNLGTIGNIFQVTPATSQSYGVNGNDPNSVANYISTQFYNNPSSAGYQNIATSYQLYQNGPNSSLSTPAQYSASSPFATFLAGLGSNTATTTPSDTNTSASPTTTANTSGNLTGFDTATGQFLGANGQPVGGVNPTSANPVAAAASALTPSWFPGWLQLGGGFLAVMLIVLGVLALVFLSHSKEASP